VRRASGHKAECLNVNAAGDVYSYGFALEASADSSGR